MKRVRSAFAALLFIASVPLFAATYTSNNPTTTNNDDSCDISLLPAATLLLPYFEVDLDSAAGAGETTLFTITNTTDMPQVARINIWTDFGYPVMNFNIYLTGYDVQSLNLYDIVRRGQIAPHDGTGFDVSPVGRLSGTPPETDRDNPAVAESTCVNLPVQLPQVFINRMRDALTKGTVPAAGTIPACSSIGGVHENATGYITIDVVDSCTATLATQQAYWTDELLYDNVLIGDYMQVNGDEDFAQINPLVHIRATPEGGDYDATSPTNLRRTFYSRFGAVPTADRRQPLPSVFAARWISGGVGSFGTHFKVFREGKTGIAGLGDCTAYGQNALITTTEIVRFDEEENPETFAPNQHPIVPLSSLLDVDGDEFPTSTNGAVAGWMYLNLDDFENDQIARQGWVVVSMRAEGRFSGDMDAQALGNGCSAPAGETKAVGGQGVLGPRPNTTP